MSIRLIVGLGNPGNKYRYTRHNLGFLTLDALERSCQSTWTAYGNGLYCHYTFNQTDCMLLKPQSFMNLSGEVVAKYIKKYSINIEDVLVVHDEADLDQGVLRLKTGGGHGGHNGLRSIIDRSGSRAFFDCAWDAANTHLWI